MRAHELDLLSCFPASLNSIQSEMERLQQGQEELNRIQVCLNSYPETFTSQNLIPVYFFQSGVLAGPEFSEISQHLAMFDTILGNSGTLNSNLFGSHHIGKKYVFLPCHILQFHIIKQFAPPIIFKKFIYTINFMLANT